MKDSARERKSQGKTKAENKKHKRNTAIKCNNSGNIEGNRVFFDFLHSCLCHICRWCPVHCLFNNRFSFRNSLDKTSVATCSKNANSIGAELERIGNTYPVVSPHNQKSCRGDKNSVSFKGKILGRKGNETLREKNGEFFKQVEKSMELYDSSGLRRTRLESNSYIYIPFVIPGDRLRPWVRCELESEYPVSLYIVDRRGLNGFRTGIREFGSYKTKENCTYFNEKIYFPLAGRYYLIIRNSGRQTTELSYGLYG